MSRHMPWKAFRRVLLAIALLAGLAALDAAWAAKGARDALTVTRDQLQAGADALQAGDLREARDWFGRAAGSARSAGAAARRPSVALAAALTGHSEDRTAVAALARSAELAAEAGSELVDVAGEIGWNGGALPGLETGGRIDLDVLRASEPGLRAAATRLEEARRLLDPLPTDGLLAPVREAVSTARRQLASRARLLGTARDLAGLLPGLLGGDGPRRYLLAMQNLDAPRGTGGFLGYFGVLDADAGRITLTTLMASDDIDELDHPVPLPPSEARYERFVAGGSMWSTNYSPDFPTSARLMLRVAARTELGRFDGVLAVDPVWLAHMLEAVGPVETPAWKSPITAGNVVDVLARQTFLFPPDQGVESNALQGALGGAIFDAIIGRAPSPDAFANAMSRSVRERHLQVYSTVPEEEALLNELGASGGYVLPQQPLAVVWQDFSVAKNGFFAERTVTQRVVLNPDGSADVSVDVTLHNGAPDGPPSVLLGYGEKEDGVPVGWYAELANVYLPANASARTLEMTADPTASVLLQEKEFGRTVAMGLLMGDPGESAAFHLAYTVPGAIQANEYRLTIVPQPLYTPVPYTVEIQAPPGTRITAASPGLKVEGGTATYAASPTTPTTVWVRFDGVSG